MNELIPVLKAGGEMLDIYEVMHRYRNDGSCDYIIEAALRLLVAQQTESVHVAGTSSHAAE
jgi:hypothetical protein